MIENQKMVNIEIAELLSKVKVYYEQQFRMVQIGCSKIGEHFEINYSFDKNYVFENLKIVINDQNTEIPSVSSVYWNAFLYENEINDLYGLKITGIAIDFKGTFYKTSQKNPFNTSSTGVKE